MNGYFSDTSDRFTVRSPEYFAARVLSIERRSAGGFSSALRALSLIDADGAARLAKNDSNRLRVINVWATWCAPCVAEFPELVALARRLATADSANRLGSRTVEM